MARDNRASKVVNDLQEMTTFTAEIRTWGTDDKSIAIKGDFGLTEVDELEKRGYEIQFRCANRCVFVLDRSF